MSRFTDFLFGKNPAKEASPYLEQIPGVLQGHYQPYSEQGQRAGNTLESEYNNLLKNPVSFYDQLASQYTPSAGYESKQKRLQQALQNTANAGGYAGNPYHSQQLGELTNSLLNEDFQNWLQPILGLYGQGMSGLEGQAERGYGAGSQLAEGIGQNLANRGALAFQGRNQRNQQKSDLMKGIMDALVTLGTGGMNKVGQGVSGIFGGGQQNPGSSFGQGSYGDMNFQSPVYRGPYSQDYMNKSTGAGFRGINGY